MKKIIYGIALILFPVVAIGQGIPVVGGPPNTQAMNAQLEQFKLQIEQIRDAKSAGVVMPVIDANQLAKAVEINDNLEKIKAADTDAKNPATNE